MNTDVSKPIPSSQQRETFSSQCDLENLCLPADTVTDVVSTAASVALSFTKLNLIGQIAGELVVNAVAEEIKETSQKSSDSHTPWLAIAYAITAVACFAASPIIFYRTMKWLEKIKAASDKKIREVAKSIMDREIIESDLDGVAFHNRKLYLKAYKKSIRKVFTLEENWRARLRFEYIALKYGRDLAVYEEKLNEWAAILYKSDKLKGGIVNNSIFDFRRNYVNKNGETVPDKRGMDYHFTVEQRKLLDKDSRHVVPAIQMKSLIMFSKRFFYRSYVGVTNSPSKVAQNNLATAEDALAAQNIIQDGKPLFPNGVHFGDDVNFEWKKHGKFFRFLTPEQQQKVENGDLVNIKKPSAIPWIQALYILVEKKLLRKKQIRGDNIVIIDNELDNLIGLNILNDSSLKDLDLKGVVKIWVTKDASMHRIDPKYMKQYEELERQGIYALTDGELSEVWNMIQIAPKIHSKRKKGKRNKKYVQKKTKKKNQKNNVVEIKKHGKSSSQDKKRNSNLDLPKVA